MRMILMELEDDALMARKKWDGEKEKLLAWLKKKNKIVDTFLVVFGLAMLLPAIYDTIVRSV